MNDSDNAPAPDAEDAVAGRTSLGELALLFLRLGVTAFGGPAAHIALMEEEVVRRRRWLSHEQFLDLMGAANLIPGPSSTEMAIYIGYQRAGWIGLLLAGICFIVPAALIVTFFAWVYVRFGALPQVAGMLYGVKPVIIAVILQALWRLGSTALKTRLLAVVAAICLVLSLLNIPPLTLLFGAGILLGVTRWMMPEHRREIKPLLLLLAILVVLLVLPAVLTLQSRGIPAVGPKSIFLFFLKIGTVLYGSGYVLLAFLRADLVVRWHWLTAAQLLDATAVGQVTPGPLFTTATFIGYELAGPWGAVVATIGIFLPGFCFVALSGPLVPHLRRSAVVGAFLDGVNVAALSLMAAVTWQLGRAAIRDVFTGGLALAGAVLLLRFRVNPTWLVLGGALLGLLVSVAGRRFAGP